MRPPDYSDQESNAVFIPNRCYFGFNDTVFYKLLALKDKYLDDHPAKLLENLKSGMPTGDAFFWTKGTMNQTFNGALQPRYRQVASKCVMMLAGDRMARIQYVYLDISEWDTYSQWRNPWFLIM